MKFTVSGALATLFASSALAQFNIQSKPFNLVLSSADKSVNNKALSACHSGAAIESLCVAGEHNSKGDFTVFHFNSSSQPAANKKLGKTGLLTWTLEGSNFNESEPLSFFYTPSTNVVLPLFEPSTGTELAFDTNNLLNIQVFEDDTQTPPKSIPATALYNWFACETNFEGYVYQNVAFVQGEGKVTPQNPSCIAVQVKRVFV